MVKLVIPSEPYLQSFLEACREFKKLGLIGESFRDPDKFDEWGPTLFERYENSRIGADLPKGYVPSSIFWLVDTQKAEFIGEGGVRHDLTPALMNFGGHIGYAIRHTHWNKGYGTLLLSLLLEKAAELGIDRALVTCNDENIGSSRVIEKNGGVLLDKIDNNFDGKVIHTRRYWVPTGW